MNETIERWKRYLGETEQFALYPEAGTGSNMALAYAALGLVDEWCECDLARRAWGELGGDKMEQNFIAEMGDLLWYVAANVRELEARKPHSILGHPHVLESHCPWHSVQTDSHGYAGRIKKLLRGDDPDPLLDKAAMHLRYVSSDLLSSPYAIRAMKYNVEKLTSRKERGVIRGDGDNR